MKPSSTRRGGGGDGGCGCRWTEVGIRVTKERQWVEWVRWMCRWRRSDVRRWRSVTPPLTSGLCEVDDVRVLAFTLPCCYWGCLRIPEGGWGVQVHTFTHTHTHTHPLPPFRRSKPRVFILNVSAFIVCKQTGTWRWPGAGKGGGGGGRRRGGGGGWRKGEGVKRGEVGRCMV